MVSLLRPTDYGPIQLPPLRERMERGISRLRLAENERFTAFPGSASVRWALRGAFALPYLALAIWLSAVGDRPTGTPNALLLQRVSALDWTATGAALTHDLFPPLTTLIAAVVPGGALGLGVLSALITGYLLQKLLEIMAQRRYPPLTVALLMIAIGANPMTAYVVTENFPSLVGLAFFGIGIANVLRFVAWGSTQAGFRAGILLMLAVLSAPCAPVYVAIAALSTPFLTLGSRYRGARGARPSQVVVVAFPAVAAIATLTVTGWYFTGDPLGVIGRERLVDSGDRMTELLHSFSSPSGIALLLTVLSAWAVAIIVRRPGAIFVSTLAFAGIMLAYVIGLIPEEAAGVTFVMLMMLAVSLLPVAQSIGQIIAIDLVAGVQVALAWVDGTHRAVVVDWARGLGLPV